MSTSDHNLLILASAAGALACYTIQKLYTTYKGHQKRTSTVFSSPPHPAWTPPFHQQPPWALADGATSTSTYHTVDPSTTPSATLYPLVISSVVPRPIAFISTLGKDGSSNLAPYSYFNAVGHDPPLVAIGFCASRLRDHGKKDSLYNILDSGEFVVNIISEWFIEAANHCCGNFPYGESEWELSGLTPLPSKKVKPPRVSESAVHMECVVKHTYEVKNKDGKISTTVVIGEVVYYHVHDWVAGKSPSGKLIVDIEKYRPMSRLGGNIYGRTERIFELPRPDR